MDPVTTIITSLEPKNSARVDSDPTRSPSAYFHVCQTLSFALGPTAPLELTPLNTPAGRSPPRADHSAGACPEGVCVQLYWKLELEMDYVA